VVGRGFGDGGGESLLSAVHREKKDPPLQY